MSRSERSLEKTTLVLGYKQSLALECLPARHWLRLSETVTASEREEIWRHGWDWFPGNIQPAENRDYWGLASMGIRTCGSCLSMALELYLPT
jgi:hypothetical protein